MSPPLPLFPLLDSGLTQRPYTLIRPFFTLAALVMASSLSFTKDHQNDNPVKFVFAAIVAVWTAVWDTLVAESSKRKAQADRWSDEKGAQFNQWVLH